MVQFMVLFLPAVISVLIFEAVSGKRLGLKNWVYSYSAFTLLVNLIVFLFKKFILSTSNELLAVGGDMTPEVAIRYLVMALVAALLTALVGGLLSRKTEFAVEEAVSKKETDKTGETNDEKE